MLKRFTSGSAVAASVLVLAVAGCGSSSKKTTSTKSSSSSATTSTSASTSTSGTTTTSHALSKSAYEAKLGPLLNERVVPALRGALSNGGARDPKKLQTAVGALNEAHDAMASLTPPPRVADLNQRAVTVIGALAADLSKMRAAVVANQKSAYLSAAKTAVQDALKMENVGNALTARGY